MDAREKELWKKLGEANREHDSDRFARLHGRRVTIGPGGPRKRSFSDQPDIGTNHQDFVQKTMLEIAKVRLEEGQR